MKKQSKNLSETKTMGTEKYIKEILELLRGMDIASLRYYCIFIKQREKHKK